jgi:prepilin-type N-terminal cleavage/methylation domain-containing protein
LRSGFTLVELLIVIVIIAMLAGLTAAAAVAARRAALRAKVKLEVTQLATALESYREKYGDYPPDFAGVNSGDNAVKAAAQTAVIRHLRKAFPRYPLTSTAYPNPWDKFANDLNTAYGINVNSLDAASALVFWLGGLPANPADTEWAPAGFSADPTNPFKTGEPRTRPFFEFDTSRLCTDSSGVVLGKGDSHLAGLFRYYPRDRVAGAPYVYFKARLKTYLADAGTNKALAWASGSADVGTAVPYLDANGTTWREPSKFQIISGGLDETFGVHGGGATADGYTAIANVPTTRGTTPLANQGDVDNITNFVGEGSTALGDEIK